MSTHRKQIRNLYTKIEGLIEKQKNKHRAEGARLTLESLKVDLLRDEVILEELLELSTSLKDVHVGQEDTEEKEDKKVSLLQRFVTAVENFQKRQICLRQINSPQEDEVRAFIDFLEEFDLSETSDVKKILERFDLHEILTFVYTLEYEVIPAYLEFLKRDVFYDIGMHMVFEKIMGFTSSQDVGLLRNIIFQYRRYKMGNVSTESLPGGLFNEELEWLTRVGYFDSPYRADVVLIGLQKQLEAIIENKSSQLPDTYDEIDLEKFAVKVDCLVKFAKVAFLYGGFVLCVESEQIPNLKEMKRISEKAGINSGMCAGIDLVLEEVLHMIGLIVKDLESNQAKSNHQMYWQDCLFAMLKDLDSTRKVLYLLKGQYVLDRVNLGRHQVLTMEFPPFDKVSKYKALDEMFVGHSELKAFKQYVRGQFEKQRQVLINMRQELQVVAEINQSMPGEINKAILLLTRECVTLSMSLPAISDVLALSAYEVYAKRVLLLEGEVIHAYERVVATYAGLMNDWMARSGARDTLNAWSFESKR